MQSNISIKFLSEKDMENAKDLDWRYEHVGSGNLGFADKVKNRVFIKSWLDSEVTKYLIDHEISHLFEMKGTDEDEHGIRHKWGSDTWQASPFSQKENTNAGNAVNEARAAEAASGNQNQGSWWSNSWDQLKPLVTYMLTNLAGSAVGNLFGGGAGAAGSAAGTMGSGALPSGAGISMGAGSVGSGIGGEVLGGALKSGIAPAIGQQTSSFMQGNPSDFMDVLGRLFTGGSQGGSSYSSPTNNFQMPSQSQAPLTTSGGSYGAGMPSTPEYFDAPGMESLTNSRGMSGQTQMPLQPGLGQAGIGNAGQDVSAGFNKPYGQGFNQMFNPMMDEYGFNQQNGGTLAF